MAVQHKALQAKNSVLSYVLFDSILFISVSLCLSF